MAKTWAEIVVERHNVKLKMKAKKPTIKRVKEKPIFPALPYLLMPHFTAIPAPKLTEEQWTAIHQHDEKQWQSWKEKHPHEYAELHSGTDEEQRRKFLAYAEKETKWATIEEIKTRSFEMIERIDFLLNGKVNI